MKLTTLTSRCSSLNGDNSHIARVQLGLAPVSTVSHGGLHVCAFWLRDTYRRHGLVSLRCLRLQKLFYVLVRARYRPTRAIDGGLPGIPGTW